MSVVENNYIGALFIEKQFQRDGIGTILIKHCKNLYDKLDSTIRKKLIKNIKAEYTVGKFKDKNVIEDGSHECTRFPGASA